MSIPTCQECWRTIQTRVKMRRGKALVNTVSSGAPDFPGDGPSDPGQTLSRTGTAVAVRVWKCPKCGHSFTEK